MCICSGNGLITANTSHFDSHIRCGFPGRVKLLLKHKADCTIANNKKELPLHRACASSNNIEVGVSCIKAFQCCSYQRNCLVGDDVCGAVS